MPRDEIKRIIGIAIIFDERQRFGEWTSEDVKEWSGMIADAITRKLFGRAELEEKQEECAQGGSHEFEHPDGHPEIDICIKCGERR